MSKLSRTVGSVGDYLREQRVARRLSLRQLAEATGVSNPYLSQIERGLRRPSAEVLGQIAKALQISAETLFVDAGILGPDDTGSRSVELAVLADDGLTERQKESLLEVYRAFRAANDPHDGATAPDRPSGKDAPPSRPPRPSSPRGTRTRTLPPTTEGD